MPAPVIHAFTVFFRDELNLVTWDGEVPRYDVQGNPIFPGNTGPSPAIWPVVQTEINRPGFQAANTTEAPWSDQGTVLNTVWGVTLQEVVAAMNVIEAALAWIQNWQDPGSPMSRLLGGPAENPYYFVGIERARWWAGQEKDMRLAGGQLCYHGELEWQVTVHGALAVS